MNKIVLSTIILISTIYAGGDITPVEAAIETKQVPQVEETGFVKTIDGYVRAGYQSDGENATDLALGVKLHIETNSWHGISAGASFYSTNDIGSNDGAGVPFFDATNNSYSILGEAYLLGQWGNTTIKLGRQEIDTPFLDTDDIGMVPNTYEALLIVNEDIANTTVTFSHVEKMAGVDAEVDPAKFENVRDNDHVQLLGIEYAFSDHLALSGWYYHLNNSEINNLIYSDLTYSDTFHTIEYELGVQYAHRNLKDSVGEDGDIYGAMFALSMEQTGIDLGVAYNRANNNYATNGFGGGPFYTSSEHLTLREANADGDALLLSAGFDAAIVGIDGLKLGIGYLTLTDTNDIESTELDLVASYAFNDNFSLDVIYSDVDDQINGDTFENTRVFVNYTF